MRPALDCTNNQQVTSVKVGQPVKPLLGVQATQGWPTGPGCDPWGVDPAESYFSFAYRRTDIMFADGHAEKAIRNNVIDSRNRDWRARWNNDHQPHPEYAWSTNPNTANQRDPEY